MKIGQGRPRAWPPPVGGDFTRVNADRASECKEDGKNIMLSTSWRWSPLLLARQPVRVSSPVELRSLVR